MKEKPAFLVRMETEYVELNLRIESLSAFINTEAYIKLGRMQKDMLDQQLYFMERYSAVLQSRLFYALKEFGKC